MLILLKRAAFDLREGNKKARQRTGGPKGCYSKLF
jgi:hypothetical protein